MMPPRFRTLLAATSLLALALGGCSGVRLETTPPPLPSPDAAEVTRQSLALDAAEIEHLARACADGGGKSAKLYQGIAQRAQEQYEALGGAWRPFDSSSPSPHATPAPSGSTTASSAPTDPASAAPSATSPATATPTPTATCDPVGVGAALKDSAERTRGAAVAATEASVINLTASISSAQYLDLARLAAADDAMTSRKLPMARISDDNAPKLTDPAAASAAVRNEDALAYIEEYVAGKTTDDDRQALLTDAALHRRAGDAIANANDLTGSKDPRLPVYRLPAANASQAQLTAEVARLRAALPQSYFDMVASAKPKSREAVLAALLQALVTADAAPAALPCLAP